MKKPCFVKIGLALAYGSMALGLGACAYFAYVVRHHWAGQCFGEALYNGTLCQLRNNPGDFLGGTLGVLFTFTATLFLFITLREQREQLRQAKEESDLVRFETTYFNILSMLGHV